MFQKIIDAFRPHIEIDGRTLVCRFVHLPTVLRRNEGNAEPWLPATETHLSAFEARYLPNDGAPARPIVALGSGVKHEGFFDGVAYIGINDQGLFLVGYPLKKKGKTTIFLASCLNDECVALEVKS